MYQSAKAAGEVGFTLLEMLVVLAILGVIAAATPRLLDNGTSRLRAATHKLSTDLVALRVQATVLRHPVILMKEKHGYTIPSIGVQRALPSGMSIEIWPSSQPLFGARPPSIAFFPDGSSTGGSVILALGGGRKEVTVRWLDGMVSVAE